MEVFDGDRRIGNHGVFSDHVAPFPETSLDFFYHYSNPIAVPSSEEAQLITPPLRQNLPPQKLRPIRCSAPGAGVPMDESVLSCNDATLGFLSSDGCGVGSNVFLPIGAGFGQSSGLEDVTRDVGMDSLEDESSSSDDGYDSPLDAAEPIMNKKRGRTSKRLELLIENMVSKVMERQEQMYKQLIETIEERERETISREVAWQQQQKQRSEQKEKLITQEITRSVALVTLIEKILGRAIPEQPEPLNRFFPEGQTADVIMNDGCDLNKRSMRWPKSEIEVLIALRSALNHKFQTVGSSKGSSIWGEISQGMSNMGYTRSAKKCKEKWDNINKYFKKVAVNGNEKRLKRSKTCIYFHELDILYKNRVICGSGSGVRDSKSAV